MQLDASLSWLALTLTPGLASRLSARVLRQFGSPEGVFRASLVELEACQLPAETAKAVAQKKAFPVPRRSWRLSEKLRAARC
jgi:predicted Rossmann fold nucleotide-binding protein DprA/Smf involved in DNA uptake